jgi:hypothetical protein
MENLTCETRRLAQIEQALNHLTSLENRALEAKDITTIETIPLDDSERAQLLKATNKSVAEILQQRTLKRKQLREEADKSMNHMYSIMDEAQLRLQGRPAPEPERACCFRCRLSSTELRPHPSIVHAQVVYCPPCFKDMKFKDGKRWRGKIYKGESNKLIMKCALCWLGSDSHEDKKQLLCDNDGCPNRECFDCFKRLRPDAYQVVRADSEAEFVCFSCTV